MQFLSPLEWDSLVVFGSVQTLEVQVYLYYGY